MPGVSPASPPSPSVSRTLRFEVVDSLLWEATLDVAENYGLGVPRWAAAEATRASALLPSINQMEEVFAVLTSPDKREGRRLTREALKARRVSVTQWALPGGTCWSVGAGDVDDHRIAQVLSL